MTNIFSIAGKYLKNIDIKHIRMSFVSGGEALEVNNEFINTIDLIDSSNETLQINDYLDKSIVYLKRIFNINQIKFIDSRRYDLYLEDNLRIMLPKKIDQKLLIFLEENFNLLKQNSNFQDYLDLRNFHEKTIRAK